MVLDKFFNQEVKFISIKNKTFVLFIALILFFMIGAVSAVNETDVIAQDFDSDDPITEDIGTEELLEESSISTTIKSNDTNIVKGKDFSVQLTDSNSTPIINQTVKFNLNDEVSEAKTDENGVAKLKIKLNPGTYTVEYSFSGEGYANCSNSTSIFVISTSTSKLNASNYVAYIGLANKYSVTLKVGDTPLVNRTVTFQIDGKKYVKKTNKYGRVSINIKKPVGTYKMTISYDGEDNIKKCSTTVKITVKKGIPTKINRISSKIFKQNKAGYFKVQILDKRGNPVPSNTVIFKINGKKYTKKTDADGYVKIKIKLTAGTYKLKIASKKTSVYNYKYKSFTIKVKSYKLKHNGFWLFAGDMDTVNFKTLHKSGINQIFLNFYCFHLHSKKYVESWIKKANSHNIKVHIWMQVCYGEDGWSYLSNKGKLNTNLLNSKVSEAVKYAKVKGVAGVHFDYIRYPGNAHKHSGSLDAVNLFVKKASTAIHKVNKKLIVSAAVMPEPSGMKTYYAQDISTLGKYLDVIVPMVYKGNYHANAKWIQDVTKIFEKQSKKAKIWAGLQAYGSDSHIVKLSANELKNDAKAAAQGGAEGIILFRYGICNFVDFSVVA